MLRFDARTVVGGVLALVSLGACSPKTPGGIAMTPRAADSAAFVAALPSVPEVRGPLALRVVYPANGAVVTVRDSSFLFGSTGTGAARLTINGHSVRVWPNGAWLAWLPFPRDSIMQFHLEAFTATERVTLDHPVRREPGRAEDSLAIYPRGNVWWPADEYLPLVAYAPRGSTVRVRLPDSTIIPLTPSPEFEAVPAAVRAFDRDSLRLATPMRADRYVGVVRGRAIGRPLGPLLGADTARRVTLLPLPGPRRDTLPPVIEAIRGRDTLRATWPIQLALLDTVPFPVTFDDDTARRRDTDGLTVGRATPGGTYHWFFPTGTKAIATGRMGNNLRVQLSTGTEAWVSATEALPLPLGALAAPAIVGSLTMRPLNDRIAIRVPLSYRVPFQVVESARALTLRLYRAVSDIDWIRYGTEDSLVRTLTWTQNAGPDVAVTVELGEPLWGYRTRWERNDLILEIRRSPAIDQGSPLRDRVIVVDAGHPPAGATGPTGLREAEANVAIALRLRQRLEDAGAKVLMTRAVDTAVGLWPRVQFAESANADLLISIHNNALPDGLNPFINNGTGVFYNHPRSVPLARAIQRGLLERLGQRDLGVARGDLALVRTTWMPAVLTEGLFMIMPEQEAALRQPEGQERYADGVFEGILRFLETRTRESR